MSIIARSKFGKCSVCQTPDTAVVKVAKDLVCLNCRTAQKNKIQVQKANERNAVRSLGSYQKAEGIVDSVSELVIDLDRVYSRWLRLANMGKDLKCDCYTCGARVMWTKAQCGHMISRSHLGLRWEPINTKVQCAGCNIGLHGNIEEFRKRLDLERPGTSEWLTDTSREVYSPTKDELKQKLFEYQQRLRLVETKLK